MPKNLNDWYDLGYDRMKRFPTDPMMISVREGIAERLLQFPQPEAEARRFEFERGVKDASLGKPRRERT